MGAFIGLLVATVTPRSYTAQSELYFAANGGESITELNDAASLVRSQMTSYAQLATAGSVLDLVARDIEWTASLEDLAQQVEVTVPVETVVLKIETTGPSPDEAVALANSVTRHVSEQALAISPTSVQGTSVVRAALITQAGTSGEASWPSRRLFTGTGAFLGLLAGCALAAALPGSVRPQRSLGEVAEEGDDRATAAK